jgi:basic membrane protein A
MRALPAAEAKVAWGYVGPVSDETWTWSHDRGRKAVEAAFPGLTTQFVENIPYSADAGRIFRQFVADGANMIFVNSNYSDFLYKVAARASNVAFYEFDGRKPTANLGTCYVQHWYPSYIAGVAAGLMSSTGKLGYIASFPVSSVFSGTNAFLLGARSVNPQATLQVIGINSWFDPQAAAQAATALLDSGAEVLFSILNDTAFLQMAEQRGRKAVTWSADLRRYGPSAYITSIKVDFDNWYVEQVRRRLDGQWTPTEDLLALGKGVDCDVWGESVPADVAAQADTLRKRILGGWSPFTGEIKDSKGKIRLPAGQTMSEVDLYNWNWSIEGVHGLDG